LLAPPPSPLDLYFARDAHRGRPRRLRYRRHLGGERPGSARALYAR